MPSAETPPDTKEPTPPEVHELVPAIHVLLDAVVLPGAIAVLVQAPFPSSLMPSLRTLRLDLAVLQVTIRGMLDCRLD